MSNPQMKAVSEIEMDKNGLFREETFTDLKVGTIIRYVPVKPDGSEDPGREPMFTGEAQLMSGAGPLPIRTRIVARTLEEAIQKYPEAINAAVEDVVDQLKELERQQMSRIVTPDEVGSAILGPGGTPGLGGGGLSGGPKIRR